MGKLKALVLGLSVFAFLVCLYSFLLGNEVFKGKFTNNFIARYFLAKGIFCLLGLFLLVRILEALMVPRPKRADKRAQIIGLFFPKNAV